MIRVQGNNNVNSSNASIPCATNGAYVGIFKSPPTKAEWKIEPGRHHAFDFVVFKTFHNNQKIEFKAKSTEGLIVYMMRLL